jgi:hypothetical protein
MADVNGGTINSGGNYIVINGIRTSIANSCLATSTFALFAWLISHQPTVLFSQNKSATSNQPAVLFSHNKPAPAISHQPTEQAAC